MHTVDAGNFALWIHKYQEFSTPDTFFGPTVGCMGYGVPAAVGAKLAHPDRVAIANCGDGGFMMTGQEMATAVQYGVNIITMVYNNSALGTIRMHQETQYPNRPSGTDFVNPDFAALGNAYGALGLKVTSDADFLPALKEALQAKRPALIEVITDLEFISPTAELAQLIVKMPAVQGLQHMNDHILMLGGGLPIEIGDDVVGGIGVGGAPGGHLDEACSQAGLNSIGAASNK